MLRRIGLSVAVMVAIIAQTAAQPSPTPANKRKEGFELKRELEKRSIVKNVKFRSVGPNIMSGRVVDIDVNPKDPTNFYVAYASGGLWVTKNNGQSFDPLFDREMVMTIGDIAVDWNRGTIWVGTGENNSSRSSYAGAGMYKSDDGGDTWTHHGLSETHHIGRIILHPSDPKTVIVAALGHLYSPNKERGIYKTKDGGKTWTNVLFVNENTGGIDLAVNPTNPNEIYAAMWERTRRAWDFVESGRGSGIYKSVDGGDNWELLTTESSGFPTGPGVGRIGLAPYAKFSSEGGIYALVDNQDRREEDEEEEEGLTKDDLRKINERNFFKVSLEDLEDYLRRNDFPEEYTAERIREMVENKEIEPGALVDYVEDANAQLFDTPVIGPEIYHSTDGGKTWKRTHDDYLDDVYFSYGYYFGQIEVSPFDPKEIYFAGVPILRSTDGGKSFESINGKNVHVDHHAIWLNPSKKGHIINGNDGGVNISYDYGEHWVKCNTPNVGQFYTVAVDMAEPYNVYGGLQDNGVWKGPNTAKMDESWHQTGEYPFESIMGGDGMQVEVDDENGYVYTGYQFGHYWRVGEDGSELALRPKHELGERPLRFNWQTPIHLSVHDPSVLYLGSNKFHRSLRHGEDMKTMSGDLTHGVKQGNVAYGTITSIHESPLRYGMVYVGTDDGRIHKTMDGGHNWTDIGTKLPGKLWVSRVQASSHKENRVYVSMNGYRWDDFKPYLYVSEDGGQSWQDISAGLPLEPINVVREDPKNENILYVGTDNGLYITFDRGASWMLMNVDMPAVAVHDLVIHPRDNDIIVATHGRSIYIAPVDEIQKIDQEVLYSALEVFEIDPVKHSEGWGRSWSKWLDAPEPEVEIPFFISNKYPAKVPEVTVTTESGQMISTLDGSEVKYGLNYLTYNLEIDPSNVSGYERFLNYQKDEKDHVKLEEADNGKYYLLPGSYIVEIKVGGMVKSMALTVEEN